MPKVIIILGFLLLSVFRGRKGASFVRVTNRCLHLISDVEVLCRATLQSRFSYFVFISTDKAEESPLSGVVIGGIVMLTIATLLIAIVIIFVVLQSK